MFGKVLSFCTRRDGAFKRKAARRLGSSRASVFLEYALVLPLTVMIISAMIEFAAFWDAKIMANHAAWTCARIATVEAGQKNYTKDKGREPVTVTKGMKTATILLMSTCAMGSMHGTASDFTKDWFERMIRQPLLKLQTMLMDKLKEKLQAALKKILSKLGDDVISKIVAEFIGVITKHLFTPLINEIAKGIGSLFQPMFDALGHVLDGNRQLRQLAYAAGRLNEFPDALTVIERDRSPFIFAKEGSFSQIGDSRLDFPRILDATVTNDSWFVANDVPWPPNGQWQRMIDVKIRWPFERAWIFPVLSPWKSPVKDGKEDPLAGRPVALGRAMAYPQPIIKNENLKSKGAEPYAPGKEMVLPDIVKKIKDKYIGFLKIAALYYHYQLTSEQIGPHDSQSAKDASYKGIGLWGGGEERKSGKDEYYRNDGLVYWMGRAPANPKDHNAWEKVTGVEDYKRCWKEVAEDEETARMWNGFPYVGPTRPTAVYWRLRKKHHWKEWLAGSGNGYQDKEWFFWGSDVSENGRHLRLKHRPSIDNYNMFKRSCDFPRFNLPEDPSKTMANGLYEPAFKSRSKDTVSVKRYRKVMEAPDADTILKLNVYTMADVWCRDTDWVRNEEQRLFRRLRDDDQRIYVAATNLIRDCSRELDNAVGGGGGGASDIGGLIDFGGIDDLIMKDPKKAVEILDKKLQELKKKVFPAVQRVDAAEKRLRELDGSEHTGFEGLRNHLSGVRDCILHDFAIAITQKSVDLNDCNPRRIRDELKRDGRGGGNPCGERETIYTTLNTIRNHFDQYDRAIREYYDAEIELGKALNCKAAKEAERGRDDPTPLPGPGGNPDRPGASTEGSGSDPDNGGDFWRLTDDGWKQYNGEPDI